MFFLNYYYDYKNYYKTHKEKKIHIFFFESYVLTTIQLQLQSTA
jgi:hypothetical protein